MLNLNTPVEPSASVVSASGKAVSGLKVPAASGPPVWKILVLDQETKDILATVLRVQDLREIGVTLHVYVFLLLASLVLIQFSTQRQLHSSRPPLSDVPAIYFVAPTLGNIRRIAQDLQKELYESFHLNFSEPLPRSLLEELAAVVAKDGTNELVDQVSLHRNVSEGQFNSFMVTGRGSVPFLHRTVGVVIFTLTVATNSLVSHVEPIRTIPTALLLRHLEFTLFH